MRVFIAVELPEEVKKEIARIQSKMTDTANKIKWVNSASMHLTLKFLGEVEKKKLNNVFDATQKITAEFDPFFMEIKGAGAFPHVSSPRVIWMGIEKGSSELTRIAGELEEKLLEYGFPREKKRWTPHITLGRIKQLRDKQLIKKLVDREKQTSGGKMRVEDITVMQSRLTPKGAVYTSLKRFSL